MKNISAEEVLHVAALSNLKLAPEEVDLFQKQLSETLNYIEVIKELEKEAVGSRLTYQVTPLTNAYREDKIDDSRILSQTEALSNSAKSYKGYFVIPGIFSGDKDNSQANL